ncbi:hypothetical protein DNTS_021626 [Danionella cerebrum]|uniref:C2H2-type domain-containing protein n=1 Tax=Danionella cerebrum TaxID=2873325 RepID=A0A553QXS4_9TELE|nr:hypothetical protein DNTS_021626 [Danionella translucida]
MAFSMDLTQERKKDAFICTECGEGFRQYAKLVRHMVIHGPTGSFFSEGVSISNGSSINASIEVALHENGMLTLVDRSVLSNFTFLFGKPSPKPPMCQTPKHGIPPSTKMPENQLTPVKCERCGQVFKSQKGLQQHQQYRALDQGFKCTLCCSVLSDQESLQNHLQHHAHERFYSCRHCGKRYLRHVALLSHQKQCSVSVDISRSGERNGNTIERSYPCKTCGLRFFWLSDLQAHLLSHSGIDQSPNNATQNQASTPDENRMPSLGNFEPCRCGVCGERFNRVYDLGEHHKSKHPDEIGFKDSSVTPAKVKERQHVVTQNKAAKPLQRVNIRGGPRGMRGSRFDCKMYSCRICHCSFVHSSSLSRHMRYHKGTLPSCNFCGRRFQQRCDVTKHIALHHSSLLQSKASDVSKTKYEIKGFEDEATDSATQIDDDGEKVEADRAAFNKEHLSAFRYKMASKPRKYKCKECFRVFGLLGVFQRHMLIHKRGHTKVLLKCPSCPSSFSFQSALDRHLEMNHSTESKQLETEAVSTSDKQEHGNDQTDAVQENIPSEILNETSESSET